MWGVILWLAFIGLMDPVRLGIAALLVSRPRPMLNLLIFWLGLLTAGLGITVAALFVLRDFMLPVIQVMHAAGTYMTAPPARITLGLLALSAAGMLVFRPSARFAGPAATPALQPKRPTVFSRLTWPAVLNGGSLRTAFLAGLGTATPPVEYGGAIIAISACEAGAGTQLCAALVFIFASYAVVELPLLSFLISPAQTCVVVTEFSEWLRVHYRPVLICAFCVFGTLMVIAGVGKL